MRLQEIVEAEKFEKQSCKMFEICPAAKEMWDYENNTVKLEEVRVSSNQAVFWVCKERGHSFRRAINNFVYRNQSCPTCKRLKSRVIGKPYMMKFWDAEKNEVNPEEISAKSLDTASWKCPNCGCCWEAVIASRKNDLCPCCDVGVRIMGGFNDFSTVYPQLGMDFKQELNPDIDATALGKGSHTRVKWQCYFCGHQWMAPIYGRIRKEKNGEIYITKCPVCAGNKRAISFGQQYPDLIARYSERNKQKLSELSGTDYHKKFLWECGAHGEYSSSLGSSIRAVKDGFKGCPYCHGAMVKLEDSFGTIFSELAKEWARENELTPYSVTPQSKYKATWRCEKGHTWQACVYTRAQGYGYCRECFPFGRRVKSFAEVYPEYREYYSNKNGTLCENHSWCSQEEAIWVCHKGHEFTSTFLKFKNKAQFSCPVCTYRKIIPGLNDFKTEYGEYAESYDKMRNAVSVDHISPKNSNGSIWWTCSEGHHFQRSVRAHIGWKGVCPVCSKRVLVRGVNDLYRIHPQIADAWDYDVNGCAPEECFSNENKYYGFCCKLGHHYFTAVKRVIENNYRCLICDGIMLDAEGNSLKARDPQLATEWSPNNDRGPESVMCDYRTPALWLCPDCGGEYREIIAERKVGDDKCPYCEGKRLLMGVSDLATTDPELAAEWSPNNELKVWEVRKSSHRLAKWLCPNCDGEYSEYVSERKLGDSSCPFCSCIRFRTGVSDLATTDPELAAEWSPKNSCGPDSVMKNYRIFVFWVCPTCRGEYGAKIDERAVGDNSCPFCAGTRALQGFNDLTTTDPELVREWSPNNRRRPTTVRKQIKSDALWNCPTCGGEYRYSINEREVGDDSCPYCNKNAVLPGFNDLFTTNPELAMQWSSNNERGADTVRKNFRLYALWICPECNGEYRAMISEHEVGDDSCQYCNKNAVLPGFNDLLTTNPELAMQWSSNNERGAETVRKNFWVYALWICPECNGEYGAIISEREVGDDLCPYCSGRKALPGVNTFKVKHPDLMGEWLELENSLLDVDPNNILDNNSVYVWWRCLICDYKYTMSVRERLMKQRRGLNPCTYCNGRRIIISHFI